MGIATGGYSMEVQPGTTHDHVIYIENQVQNPAGITAVRTQVDQGMKDGEIHGRTGIDHIVITNQLKSLLE